MSAPESIINICSGVRLDNRYEHSIYFVDAAAQQEYFAGKVVKTFPAYSYLRKSWPLQVQATMEQARTWSYLYFRNGTGKYYYYFINQIEYKNPNMVELSLELDVIQTYLFDFEMLDCFVERQHTETDKLGEYTLDEGLDVGELRETSAENWIGLSDMCVLVLSSINPNYTDTEKPVPAMGGVYDNVFSGLSVWAVEATDFGSLSAKLDTLSEVGFIDGIMAMWMYPKECVVLGGENEWGDDVLFKVVTGCTYAYESYTYSKVNDAVGGIVPKNNKTLCYPYRFLYATNNQGGSAVYRFERFEDPSAPVFRVKGSISPDATVKMYPDNYNGTAVIQGRTEGGAVTTVGRGNYDQGLTLGNYPSCAWDADVYKLWLAQNQNQLQHTANTAGLAIAGGAITAVASLAMGNVVGAVGGVGGVIGGAQQIGALMAQKADMAIQPPQSRGSFSSNVNMVAKMHTFTFYTKGVDKEHAKAIDDYFTMYGYKLNRVQKPNLCARPAFTYIKTVGCNISSRMGQPATRPGPQFCTEDRIKITSIFDHGITFWVDGDRVADYSQNNKPKEV